MKQQEAVTRGLRTDLFELVDEGNGHDCTPSIRDAEGLSSGARVLRRECGHGWELSRIEARVGALVEVRWDRCEELDRPYGVTTAPPVVTGPGFNPRQVAALMRLTRRP